MSLVDKEEEAVTQPIQAVEQSSYNWCNENLVEERKAEGKKYKTLWRW